ncbi:MAG: spore germination protein [Eubacteriales bacterium]|nr:spore germination protein [Eubacteriales bacterium]
MSIISFLKKIFVYDASDNYEAAVIENTNYNVQFDSRKVEKPISKKVSSSLNENFLEIREMFSVPTNNDVIIKEFSLKGDIKGFLFFYEGMVNVQIIDDFVIRGLLELPFSEEDSVETLAREIKDKFIIHAQVNLTDSIDLIAEEVNFGGCGLFIDGLNQAFALDVRTWEHRSITKPENEQSIYGPQEAFAEMLRTNTILIRKILKTEKLIAEGVKVGNISKTRGVILYINDIANENLVKEVRNRINAISIDYIISIEEVEQLIETGGFLAPTQTMSTERPDRTARALSEGRVVMLLNGSPRALVFPTNAYELTHAASDAFLRAPYANMSRIVRLIGMFVSVLLPALYLAVTLFHQEMLPTYLLYAISAARANVPFPSVVELLLMDFSFEMIREAGIRMPGPVGQTLGIVGGLILGQSAVSAKIVSPIMIVIIAITGIGSFATADYSLSWNFRILRLIFILLAAFAGLFGIGVGLFLYTVYVSSINNFGIPFLSPFPGSDNGSFFSALFVRHIWKREHRPSFLSTKRTEQEPQISRMWKNGRNRK